MTIIGAVALSPAVATAWATISIAVVSLLVGSVQCLLIWIGLRRMKEATELRERESERRHRETMAALDAQTRVLDAQSKSLESRSRSLDAHTKSLEAHAKSLEAQTEAFRELLRRTAAPAGEAAS